MRETRGIDTLVGLALGVVLVLTGLFVGLMVWIFNHGGQSNPNTVPVLSSAAAAVAGSMLAGVEGLVMRRGETGMVVRLIALGLVALALGGFLLFAGVKLLTPGH